MAMAMPDCLSNERDEAAGWREVRRSPSRLEDLRNGTPPLPSIKGSCAARLNRECPDPNTTEKRPRES